MIVQNLSELIAKLSITAGLFSAGFLPLVPAQASVLVQPRVFQEEEVSPDATPTTPTTPAATGSNIVEVANNTIGFSTLSAAITAANIGGVLSAEGPLTVFAPTDEAFAALPAESLEALLERENADLLAQLLYNHAAYGDLTSDQLTAGQLNTFDGTVDVAITPVGVQVDGANVIQADVEASNGVIHVIDQVLLPAGFAEQLQARIEGTDAATASEPTSEQVSAPVEPVSTTAPATATPAPPDTTTESPETEASVEESSVEAAEETPVRALW
ncbi:MAG: fasciclin domain-containing protein [Phormidesmis sp.]